ncbi:MAG: PilN domain-containing protein [Gammaproteobacteria bacterium]
MPRINLLPWRDELRQQRRNQFFAGLGGAAGGAVVVVVIGLLTMNAIVNSQEDRNTVLKEEIKILDVKINEILDLEVQKDRLVARMKIIEQLQQSRPEVVHLFDELVHSMPNGVHLSKVKQNGKKLELKGAAESNTRVSALMRNIDKSAWLADPDLSVVEVKTTKASVARSSEFTVFAKQVATEEEEES